MGHCAGTVSKHSGSCYTWNTELARKPSAVIQARGAADVVEGIKYAASEAGGGKCTVSSGGHGFTSKVDGQVCISLNEHMNSVVVDPSTKTAWVEGGAKGIDLDNAAALFGLATPSGTVRDTGVGGLATGGGIGWLSRKHGLMIDNILEAQVVTGKGELVTANAETNPDLFWALRGGSSHCGIVTAFKFQLYEETMASLGPLVHPLPAAAAAAKKAVATADAWESNKDLSYAFAFSHGPDGSKVGLSIPFTTNLEIAEASFKPLHEDPAPVAVMHQVAPYKVANSMIDGVTGAGAWHEKALFFTSMTDEIIDTIAKAYETVPSTGAIVLLFQLGGKIADVADEDTVFSARKATWWVAIFSNFTAENRDSTISWVDDLWRALQPSSMPKGGYANTFSDPDYIDAYADNKARLIEARAKWNPDGVLNGSKNLS